MRRSKVQIAPMSELVSQPRKPRRAPAPANGEATISNTAIENTEGVPTPTPTKSSIPTVTPTSSLQTPEPPPEKAIDQLYMDFWTLINTDENPLAKKSALCGLVSKIISKVMEPDPIYSGYNWLIIHDPLTMLRSDTDKIYKAIGSFKEKKDIGLIITSGGGEIEPAYLISKLCRESCAAKFIVIVPRRAKSAATLLCCGADEIHMGQMSELGPIDPQFNDLPALGLKNAVQHIAELANQYPKASDMFAKYLASTLPNLVNLGYYERVAESAVQYAERLLKKRVLPLKGTPHDTARQLVYGYMDHGFVIDQTEAESIFGNSMIKIGENEYNLGNKVYDWLSLIDSACGTAGYGFYMYGHPDSEASFYKKKK